MQKLKTVADYIMVFENAISTDLCDEILKEFSDESEWIETVIGSNKEVNKTIRSAQTIFLSRQEVMQKNLTKRQELDKQIFNCATNVIKKYSTQADVSTWAQIQEDSGYELLRYKENQFYIQHVDFFKAAPRSVSCSFALNDNYDGGEFAFFDRELKYKIPKGSALMFPSNFMYPHEIMPVTHGVRYSVITWFV